MNSFVCGQESISQSDASCEFTEKRIQSEILQQKVNCTQYQFCKDSINIFKVIVWKPSPIRWLLLIGYVRFDLNSNPRWALIIRSLGFYFLEDLMNSSRNYNQETIRQSGVYCLIRYGEFSWKTIPWRSDEWLRCYLPETVNQSGGCCLIRYGWTETENNSIWGSMTSSKSGVSISQRSNEILQVIP